MTKGLDVEPRWWGLVTDLLREHAPRPCRVYAFGLRTTARARKFSDLDLAIDAGRPLHFGETGGLEDALEESPLPWRVDIVDLATCSETLRREVENHAVLLLDLQPKPADAGPA